MKIYDEKTKISGITKTDIEKPDNTKKR